jgi:NACalpha-BTF3-like transcription factor
MEKTTDVSSVSDELSKTKQSPKQNPVKQKPKKQLTKEELEELTTIRKEQIVKLVSRQTDYNENDIKKKLEAVNYNYMAIIDEYLGVKPTPSVKKSSLNQQTYREIGNFLRPQYKK